jgi:hypothetical protein
MAEQLLKKLEEEEQAMIIRLERAQVVLALLHTMVISNVGGSCVSLGDASPRRSINARRTRRCRSPYEAILHSLRHASPKGHGQRHPCDQLPRSRRSAVRDKRRAMYNSV